MFSRLHRILNPSFGKSLRSRRSSRYRSVCTDISILENRVLLSAASWTGAGNDLSWNTANNWSTHAVPVNGDDVTINVTQGTTISGPSNPVTLHSLTIASGNLHLGGAALEVTNGVSISSNQTLVTGGAAFTSDSTLSGTGTLDLTGSTANLGNLNVNNTIPNLVLTGATLTGSGTLTIPVGGTLATDHSTFNVAVVNQGTMLVSTQDFTNTTFNSTFTNAAGAHFNVVVNSTGHGSAVTIANGFTNLGTISLEGGSSGVGSVLNVTKQQLINAASGVITFTGVTGVASTINANLLNQGTINVPANQIYNVGKTNNFTNTATLTGAGTIDFSNCPTVDLGALNITSSVPQLTLFNTTLTGTSTITIAAGVTVLEDRSTINAPISIKGTLDLVTEDFTNTNINGAVSIFAGGHFNIQVNGAGHGSVVTVAKGFTNSGTISLESGSNNSGSTLNVTQGILTNAVGSVLTFAGVTGVPSTVNANLVNQGTINVPASQTYRVGTTNTFTNTATISGAGTIDFTACHTINLGAFTVNASVPTIVLFDTTLLGTSTITVAAGSTLLTNRSTFNAPVTVAGTLNVETEDFTNSNFNGTLSVVANANLNIAMNNSGHGSSVTVAHGFTNSGTITLESGSSNTSAATLNVTQGTLVNAATGKITFSGAMFAPSTINANLTNQGTILVPAGQTYKVSQTNLFTNTATLSGPGTIDFSNCPNIVLGALTISSTIPTLVFVNTTVAGASTLTIQTGFTQATNRTKFNVPVVNQGLLEVATDDGTSSTFTGPLTNLAGAHFDIVLNTSGHGSAVTVSNGFVNSGVLTLLSGNGGTASTLNVTQGTLTNSSTGTITSSGPLGTANNLNGNLNNAGVINISAPLTYTGLFSNTGTINVSTTQKASILGGEIQKPATLYPSLATVTYNGLGTSNVPQTLEALSSDVGAQFAGFTNNSVFGTLSLTNGTYVRLVDQTDDDARGSGAEAVYANTLNVPIGTTLDLNNLHLYATVVNVQGTILNGTVTKVVPNHAPAGTPKTVTTLEDTAYVVKTADFGFTDPNDTPANALFAVKMNTLSSAGVLKDNGVAVTVGQIISASDIAGSKLVFEPTANLSGGPFFLCKFQVQDNGGTASAGVDTDPTGRVMSISLTAVNDAPTGASHTVAMTKNTSFVFAVSNFGFSDVTDSPANTLLTVQMTTLPTLGSLTDNGLAVTTGQRIAVADITSGKLKFTPVVNGTGANYSHFTFQVQDNGGTANGGIDTDATAKTMTFSVT